MKLYQIIEQWAQLYKPIQHNPDSKKDCAFYLIDSINKENGFVRNHNTCKSPCVAFSTVIDAQVPNSLRSISYQYVIYLLARQPASTQSLKKIARTDEETATDIKLELDGYVRELLNYLSDIRRTGRNPITREAYDSETLAQLNGLQLDKAMWGSLPERYESWWIVGLQLDLILPNSRCVNAENYIVTTQP